MQKTRSRRATRIRLTLTYTLMILSVAVLVGGLYMVIQGYRFNKYEGQIEQGGLVQFNSQPGGAAVWLDGKELAVRTQGKLTLGAGKHTVAYKKTGYLPWEKQIDVRPGQVLWLDYALLVPATIKADKLITLPQLNSAVATRDSKTLALMQQAASPLVSLINVSGSAPQLSTVTLPASSFTATASGVANQFQVVAWASDNKTILIRHSYGESVEWISADTTNIEAAKNLTSLLGVAATQAVFSPSDSNTLLLLTTTNEIRKASLDQKTLSGPLVQQVANFTMYDDNTIVYTTTPDTNGLRKAAYLTIGASSSRIVAQYTSAATPLRFVMNKYDGTAYLAVQHGSNVLVYSGDISASDAVNPAAFTQVSQFTLNGDIRYIGFSTDKHRFIYAQTDTQLGVYDVDLGQVSNHSFATPVAGPINWVDKTHFTVQESNTLRLYDYDATNGQALFAGTSAGSTAVLTGDSKYIYAFTSDGSALVRVKLVTD